MNRDEREYYDDLLMHNVEAPELNHTPGKYMVVIPYNHKAHIKHTDDCDCGDDYDRKVDLELEQEGSPF